MPELPEVETVVRALRAPLVGRTFTEGAKSLWPRQVIIPPVEELSVRLVGQTITAVNRRGKYILIELNKGDTLIVHLKMTGHLSVVPSDTPLHKHDRATFPLDNGTLRFRDMRKFGRIYLVADAQTVVGKLGPEPLTAEFTPQILAERLLGRKRPLKPLLLDQTTLAGLGNIYVDEALFHANLHPKRLAHTLQNNEIMALHMAIQHVLQLGINREGASISNYVKPDGTKGNMQDEVKVFRRTGQPCYTCATTIERIKLGGRSTHFCPNCQPEVL